MLLKKLISPLLSNPYSLKQFQPLQSFNPTFLHMKSIATFVVRKQQHINVDLSHYIQKQQTIDLLNKKGILKFFPIQAQTFKHISQGKDVIAGDKTGSGKTIAFALPVIERMRANNQFQQKGIKFVVLAPTRELACQIGNQIDSLKHSFSQYKVMLAYGGTPINNNQRQLRRSPDILVATPGRMLDLIERKLLDFSKVSVICIDEADFMFDIGFQYDIDEIVSFIKDKTTKQCQLLCFSATLNQLVTDLTKKFMKNNKVLIGHSSQQRKRKTPQTIKHCSIQTSQSKKIAILNYLIEQKSNNGRTIIFVNTKRQADKISSSLRSNSVALHGDVEQKYRMIRLNKFKNGQVKTLVATDVAARGLDIPNVQLIINYDLPKTTQCYIHRAGRTGRAGKQGVCISILDSDQNQFLLNRIKKNIQVKIERLPIQQNLQKYQVQKFQKISNKIQTQQIGPNQSQTKLIFFDFKDVLTMQTIQDYLGQSKMRCKNLQQVRTKSGSKFFLLQAFNKQQAGKICQIKIKGKFFQRKLLNNQKQNKNKLN